MEENVALDSKKQRKFVKSIRGIKKLIKKNEGKPEPQKNDEEVKPKKPFSMKLKKDGKINKSRKRKERGLVYLSHIPHGFYENEMTQYFKQFGVVTNARVIRSKRTGNSKGFAFVEFKEPAVGQIVAETMNNYLMGKRLIKAAYIPPEKQKLKALRKNWNNVNNPAHHRRLKTKKAFNADKDESGELIRARKLLSKLNKNKKKLSEIGINYDFFAPVDVPEGLLNDIVKQEKEGNKSVTEESKPKKAEKRKQEARQVSKPELVQNGEPTNEGKRKKNKNQKDNKQAEVPKKGKPVEVKKDEPAPKANKKEKLPVKVNQKQQNEKNQKLKDAGVKPAEFIKVAQDSEDSDDDSDATYDNVLQKYNLPFLNDEDDESGDEEEASDEDDSGDEGEENDDDDESDEEEAPKPATRQTFTQKAFVPKKQAQKQQQQKPQAKKQQQKKPVEAKKKAPQKPAVSPKKFEKQNQKPMKKQFKKK